MQSFKIYKNLAWLNELPTGDAEVVFFECCGSSEWVRLMVKARPFMLVENLYETAERAWFSLTHLERREAYAVPPKIELTRPAMAGRVPKKLAEANRLYEQKFGFIFIVCANGKSTDEMVAICRARLGNSAETELQIAAEEQRKITEVCLNSFLER